MKIYTYSYGGSGITSLRRSLQRVHGRNVVPEHNKHNRKPPNHTPQTKAIYMFSNPMDAVLSFFRRQSKADKWDFPSIHCNNLERKMPKWISLEKFLNDGKDYFELENHWRNWTQSKVKFPLLLIRYESVPKHIEEIAKFTNSPVDFYKFKKRNSNWENRPKHIKDKLYSMYGKLWEDIKNFDEIKIKNKL